MMNEAPNLLRNWLITCFAGTLGVRASPSWAAAAALPWDQTLIALQNMLVGAPWLRRRSASHSPAPWSSTRLEGTTSRQAACSAPGSAAASREPSFTCSITWPSESVPKQLELCSLEVQDETHTHHQAPSFRPAACNACRRPERHPRALHSVL